MNVQLDGPQMISVQVLDAQRHISVGYTRVAGRLVPTLQQGPVRMFLPGEVIEKLGEWKAQQEGRNQ